MKEKRKYYASKRGSWNGGSPVTRVVQSRKIYDRKRMKSADRKICAEWISPAEQFREGDSILFYQREHEHDYPKHDEDDAGRAIEGLGLSLVREHCGDARPDEREHDA